MGMKPAGGGEGREEAEKERANDVLVQSTLENENDGLKLNTFGTQI